MQWNSSYYCPGCDCGSDEEDDGFDECIMAVTAAVAVAEYYLRRKRRRSAALAALLEEEEESDEEEEDRCEKLPRRVYLRPDYKASAWGIMLEDPALHDSCTREYRSFRRRFRLPFPVFQLLELVKERGWFPSASEDVAGKCCIPVELKVG